MAELTARLPARAPRLRPSPGEAFGASKVPELTALFWLTKVLTTGMGETTSDFLFHRFNPFVVGPPALLALVVALWVQFTATGYHAWRYWSAVVWVAVVGTMAADALHVELGVPYAASSVFYLVVLAAIFMLWRRSEGTLSIHSIRTPRREGFYWATVLATFALGTAFGDLTAVTLHLGYLASGVAFAFVIAVPVLGYWRLHLDAVLAFWFAYVTTRPLGASLADWLGVSHARSGLGLGTGPVSLVLLALIAGLVAYQHARVPDPGT